MTKLIKASFFICVHGLLPPEVIGCEEDDFYSSEVGGFQMGDLVGKIGGVTEAEQKHNKLFIMTP